MTLPFISYSDKCYVCFSNITLKFFCLLVIGMNNVAIIMRWFETEAQKRKRSADVDDTTVRNQKRRISCNANGPIGFASNLGLTDESSMQLSMYHGSRSYDVSASEAPKTTRAANVVKKSESEGKSDLNCVTTRTGKRSRPCSWKRRKCKRQKQSTSEEDNLNIQCNLTPTNTDGMLANLQHDNTRLSCHEKVTNCSCEIL